jgi:hypothetical protein
MMKQSYPYIQISKMLDWFHEIRVYRFDVKVRAPNYPGAPYESDDWTWKGKHDRLRRDGVENLLSWLRMENLKGPDVYLRPHRHDKHPVIFLDDLSLEKAGNVVNKYCAFSIETSPNNTQVWLSIDRMLTECERKLAQQQLAKWGYTDKASVSGEHFGRMCGMKSHKRDCWVNVFKQSYGNRYSPTLEEPESFPLRGGCAIEKEIYQESISESEREFSMVLSKLRRGESRDKISQWLIAKARNRGKRSPHKYSERTILKAISIMG